MCDDLSNAALSDGVAAVIAGTLSGSQASDMLNRLLLNASGGQAHSYVDVTNQVLVANLPVDVVKILPWTSVANGPTGAMPQDFWQKIGAIASTVVNALVYVGQLVYKGLVALGTFLVNLAQAIADWGMKALGTVVSAAVAVAKAIGDALSRIWEWALGVIQSMVAPLVDAIKGPMRDEGITLTASGVPADTTKDSAVQKDYLESVWDMIGSGNFFNLVVAFVLAAQVVAAIAANVIFPGAGSIVVKAIETIITSLLIGFLVAALVDTVLQGLDAVFKAAVPGTDAFWGEGVGMDVLGVISDLSSLLLNWNKVSKPGFGAFRNLPTDAKWLAMSLAGLGITLVTATWHGASAIAGAAVGLGFAVVGTIKTLESDAIDKLTFPVAPLKYAEEAVSLAALGYAMASFADTVSREA